MGIARFHHCRHNMNVSTPRADEMSGVPLADLAQSLRRGWWLVALSSLVTGAIAFGISKVLPKTYTARTTVMPPQQQQSSATAVLSSMGSLANLAGNVAGGLKSPADQYAALMQSVAVMDPIIDQFKLQSVYEEKYREDVRKELLKNVRVGIGKKDGLITVEVDDRDPKRAADLANAHVAGLRELTNRLAVSEAQMRRVFFEQKLKEAHERLTKAQIALQGSGVNQSTLKVEPRIAAENYSRLQAQITAAEARLQSMRATFREGAPEVVQQAATIATLRAEVNRAGAQAEPRGDADYVSRYREFKYQEALFELFARQYEAARVDEGREGALLQVVDLAVPPEKHSFPRSGLVSALAALLGALGALAWLLMRAGRR
jgi:uncharacterized protein involved in exopolysaccharide biosynthesis